MGLLLDSVLSELLAVLLVLCGSVYWYFHRAFRYWEDRGVPTMAPSFPAGNIWNVVTVKEPFGVVIQDLYTALKPKGPFSGFYLFGNPALLVTDPELVKCAMVRDFGHFHDRGVYFNEKQDPLSAHLFSLEGNKWRNLRTKLTPTFTSGKLKMMYPTLIGRAEELQRFLDKKALEKTAIDVKDVLARFTTDVIGTCAFGIECNTLNEPDSEFRKNGVRVFTPTAYESILAAFVITFRSLARKLGIKVIPESVSKFFTGVVNDTIEYREKNGITRPDFMQLLIQLKNKGQLEDDVSDVSKVHENLDPLTMDEVAAQAFVFFLAGFETSSTTMSFCLYELAKNEQLQGEIRDDVVKVLDKHGGQMTYEALLEMEYLDRAIYETMRKYPTLPILNREVTKDYSFPDSDITLSKGTQVFIPVRGLHHDPEYFPQPDVFDPERFTEENKATRHAFTYLPFGEGPRICIGMRFGMMQTRLGLVVLLKNYRLKINAKTPSPMVLDPKAFLTVSVGGIWLDLEPIKQI